MAKGSMGGQRAGGSLSSVNSIMRQRINQAHQQQTQQAQVDDTQQASAFSTDYNTFMAMSDDEKADVISDAIKQGVPDHLAQNDFQRFVFNSGLNDKPDVVDDATLDSMHGTEMFRTVNDNYNKVTDIGYNADTMAKQVQGGRYTYMDGNASVLGKGIYFAGKTNYTSAYYESTNYYGKTKGDVKKSAVMRAKLNSNAKIMNYDTAKKGVSAEIASGSKLGKVSSKSDSASRVSIFAMTKGYNVLQDGNYFNVLNRNAMTMSKDIKAISRSGKWK